MSEKETYTMISLPSRGVLFAETVEVPRDNIASFIDADFIEIVRPEGFARMDRPDLVLIVDESGAIDSNFRLKNPCASELYGFRRHGGIIFGDALVAKEVMGPDGPELTDLTEDDITEAMTIMYTV